MSGHRLKPNWVHPNCKSADPLHMLCGVQCSKEKNKSLSNIARTQALVADFNVEQWFSVRHKIVFLCKIYYITIREFLIFFFED